MSIPIDFDTWYSPWMKTLAANYSKEELENRLLKTKFAAKSAGLSHLNAIKATGSMTGSSARRAHARNVVSSLGEEAIAISGALEIHNFFPEKAKAVNSMLQLSLGALDEPIGTQVPQLDREEADRLQSHVDATFLLLLSGYITQTQKNKILGVVAKNVQKALSLDR